jgi:hypothetical protein
MKKQYFALLAVVLFISGTLTGYGFSLPLSTSTTVISTSTLTSTRTVTVTTSTTQIETSSTTSILQVVPSIDHSAKAFCDDCSSVSIVISTTHSYDLLYILTFDSNTGNDTESISSNPPLDWKNRISFSTPNNMDIWYAVWQSQGEITIALSTGSQLNTNEVIIGFGINNANISQPFSSPLPDSSICSVSCGTYQSVTISTNISNSLVIGSINAAGGGIMSAGPCCIHISGITAGDIEYAIEPVPQIGLVLNYSSQLVPTRWIFVGDAVAGL